MKRTGVICASILLAACSLAAAVKAQDRKIEISPYAGGYFSAGFQTFQTVQLFPTPAIREIRPADEPNSGMFGVRASYDLNRRFALEGTFGFSPAGRDRSSLLAELRPDPVIVPYLALYPAPVLPVPAFRGKDTYHYSGNVVFRWRKSNGWSPFLTGGLGAVQRTGELALPSGPFPVFVFGGISPLPPLPGLPPSPRPATSLALPFPSPSQTDFSVNFGGGVKKYFTDRCGIRFDFRNYTSEVGADTVNNMEVSLGLIFKM